MRILFLFIFFLSMMMAALLPTAIPIYKEGVDASRWFEVESVHVHDTVVNTTPLMEVDRTINKPFHAEWIAEIHISTGGDGFSFYCKGEGQNDYHPSDKLPLGDSLNLDWWTWPKQCQLPPGKYRVDTLWVLKLPNYPDKQVRARSNVFEVKPNDN